MKIRVLLHYAVKSLFYIFGKTYWVTFQKWTRKSHVQKSKTSQQVFPKFLCGPEKWEQTVGFCGKWEEWELIYPQIWYMNRSIISVQTVLLPMS